MRRALFVHSSADLYGSDIAALHVARSAVSAGWEVTFTVPGEGPLLAALAADGIPAVVLDPLTLRRADLRPARLPATLVRVPRDCRALLRLSRRARHDLVYTTTAPVLGGALLARRWRVPHVHHVHEIFWFGRPAVKALEAVLGCADSVICCSGAVRDQLSSAALRGRALVAPTGIVPPVDVACTDPLAGAPPARIICVARLNEWKGQSVLLDALALLRREGHDATVSLVGDVYGDQTHFRDRLEEQARRLRIDQWVEFEGERRDALQLVARSDVLVLPSRRAEPFGMALVEAMALARPVVATAAGGPAEIVTDGHDGLLVPPGDARALASAIARYLADPAWARQVGERASVRARAFDIRQMAESVVAEFERLAGG